MKRILAGLLAALMLLCFAACGLNKSYDDVKRFKAGVWSVVEGGEEVATYTFTEDGKGCLYEKGETTVPFDYEVRGSAYYFHMGDAENEIRVKATFQDENTCVFFWRDPPRGEELHYKGPAE